MTDGELTRSFLGGTDHSASGGVPRAGTVTSCPARWRRRHRAPDAAEPGTAEGRRMTGFKKFLLHGSLIDLAVAVVVGVAFSQVVQALIKDLITPLIAALGGKPNFSSLVFSINKSHYHYGDCINVALYF